MMRFPSSEVKVVGVQMIILAVQMGKKAASCQCYEE